MYDVKKIIREARNRSHILIWGIVLMIIATIAVGDVEQQTTKSDNGTAKANDSNDVCVVETDKVSNNELLNTKSESQSVPVIQSVTFKKDVGIRDALHFLAVKYHKNIVPSTKVDGLITVTSLYDVTFEEAMEAILGYGFTYERDGSFIKVYTTEEYKTLKESKYRMTYEVFTLYYISAAEAKKLVMPVLSDKAKVETTTAAETGVPTSESISSETGGGDTTAMNDTMIIYDYPENIERAKNIITAIDVQPKQVLIESTILSATLTEDTQFGIDWQTLHGSITSLSGATRGASDYFKFGGSSIVDANVMIFGAAHDNIGAFIKALEEVTDVTVLASPKILTINKQLGQVYIGTKLGYKSQTSTTDGGTSTSEVEFLDTGTKLSFRPYICNDGYIRMDIHPKDSSGSLNVEKVPDEVSAELVTNILVKDGETIVIGGLFRDKITAKKIQVPVLGNIPFIGAAFKGTADKVERQEVIVLLTPHIIQQPNQAEGQARDEDMRLKAAGANDSLQWIGRSKLARDSYAEAVKYYQIGDKKKAMQKANIALELYPTYLEAIRLKERIIRETDPKKAKMMKRVILREMEKEEAGKWRRY
ncbi:MAG: type II secretion system protein GspD [Planctomycetota bacterium]|jgi:type II secretory pathway component GspD/PulD (secretin)